MKNELFVALGFVLSIVLYKVNTPYFDIVLLLSIIPIMLFFIFDLKNNLFWKQKKWLFAIFSIYYKVLIYVSVLFMAMHYSGRDFVSLFTIFSTYTYMFFAYRNSKKDKEALYAFVYVFIGVFIIFILR